jgi:hypothetical protein
MPMKFRLLQLTSSHEPNDNSIFADKSFYGPLNSQMDKIANFYDAWRDVMDNKSDSRTTNWFMMGSPFYTMAVSLAYIYAAKVSNRLWESHKR